MSLSLFAQVPFLATTYSLMMLSPQIATASVRPVRPQGGSTGGGGGATPDCNNHGVVIHLKGQNAQCQCFHPYAGTNCLECVEDYRLNKVTGECNQ